MPYKNIDEQNAYHRQYYKLNKEKISEYNRKSYFKHKEKRAKTHKAYYLANKEKLRKARRAASKRYNQRHIERLRAYWREYGKKHKQRKTYIARINYNKRRVKREKKQQELIILKHQAYMKKKGEISVSTNEMPKLQLWQ